MARFLHNVEFYRTVKEPGRYSDGQGLQLLVRMRKGNLSKSWVQRLVVNGNRRDKGLGTYMNSTGHVLVTPAEARDVAYDNWKIARNGGDPWPRVTEVDIKPVIPTFREAAELVMENHPKWPPNTRRTWFNSLVNHVFPTIGDMPLDQIRAAPHLVAVLQPHWYRSPNLAKNLRQRIAKVMRRAVADNIRADNPGESVSALMDKPVTVKAVNYVSVSYSELPYAYGNIHEHREHNASLRLALEFMVLTGTRPNEAQGARWSEMKGRTWTIPASRMKANTEHIVPLSGAAMSVVERAMENRQPGEDSRLLFPAASGGEMKSTLSLRALAKKITGDPEMTAHGFRSSLRTWLRKEQEHLPNDVREFCLAHEPRGQVEKAYQRDTLVDERRPVMEAWGVYVTSGQAPHRVRAVSRSLPRPPAPRRGTRPRR